VSYSFVIYDKRPDEHLAVVTINRPEVLNAVHSPATEELTAIWDDYAGDPELWVAILTGAGDRAFTVGDDLKHANSPPSFGAAGWGGLVTRFNLWKPVIAAVNGWALGGGLEIALACDLAVASENARFGCPEARIGGSPSKVAQQLLRQLPRKVAMAMLYTGQPIDAQEAYRVGLVNEVVPADQLLPAAERWAREIVSSAPLGVQAAKEAAYRGDGLPLEAAMLQSYPANLRVRDSADSREGRRAFAEKRPPRWEGR
jgi:enoyl-CoA hydratase/carnithine racemase